MCSCWPAGALWTPITVRTASEPLGGKDRHPPTGSPSLTSPSGPEYAHWSWKTRTPSVHSVPVMDREPRCWQRPGYEVPKHHSKPPTADCRAYGLKKTDLIGIPCGWR